MIKKTLLVLLTASSIYATDTTTTTEFHDVKPAGTDKYGNNLYNQSVTITTKNFKVENFWKKFSFGGTGEDSMTFKSVSKTGNVRIIMETTSACTLDNTLSSEGCSGQKPFLLNDEVLTNPINGTSDEYEVAFTEANGFFNSDQNGFYPLDISRDTEYYKDPAESNPGTSDRGFFGFFTSSFDFIFSKTVGFGNSFFGNPDIADVLETGRSDEAEDRRQRYIANIIAGVDKEHRMTKNLDGSTATQIDAPVALNTPTSLLHYAEAKKTTEADQCKFMFLNLSNDGLMCRMMGGFGMDAWMPFFNKTKSNKIQASFIMGDTENSLLAMTGQIENVPYMTDVGGNDNSKMSFLKNMLKPLTSMVDYMKSMLFGPSKSTIVANPVVREYLFDEDEAMTMTFAITNDGTEVNDFSNFKLLRIRSVYGDEINSCKVKKTKKVFGMPFTIWKETFTEDGSNSRDGKSSPEWVDWCQESTGGKGMFDYLSDWSSGGVFNPINWMKGFFNAFFGTSYDILELKNTIGRGLILNIKKTEADISSKRNTQTFKLMGTN